MHLVGFFPMKNYSIFTSIEGIKIIYLNATHFVVGKTEVVFFNGQSQVAVFNLSQILGFAQSDQIGKKG